MNKTISEVMKRILFSGLLLMLVLPGCERAVSDLDEPDFPTDPNVFIDGFSGGLEYAAFGGSVPTAFQVDNEVTFEGDLAMRFEVPDVGDPRGAYAGGAFFTPGPRDLSGYNALTFYAKSTESVPMDIVGFGNDLGENTYVASVTDFRVNTNWKKYIIPIPNPTKLTEEKGLFFYSFGPVDGEGYTVWIDELRFENLGTLGQPLYEIQGGQNDTTSSFTGVNTAVSGLLTTYGYTLPGVSNQIVQNINTAPAYFDFSSTNSSVASVNDLGEVTVGEAGSADITASVNNVVADGSLTIQSQGAFDFAPVPTEDPADVISIFSNEYQNVPVDFYNGFYEPFQTTTSNDFDVNGDNILNYENFNFVGIEFNQNVPTIDGSEMTNFKLSIYLPNAVPANSAFTANLRDFGADGNFGGGDDTIVSSTVNAGSNPALVSGQWITIDIDISGMAGKSNLGQIVFDSDAGPGLNGASIYVDNIYLYK